MTRASVASAAAAALAQCPLAPASAAVAVAAIKPAAPIAGKRRSAMRWMWPNSLVSVRSSTAAIAGRMTIAPKTSVP
jgi:hypothetical protein